jgi:hypothetical protein
MRSSHKIPVDMVTYLKSVGIQPSAFSYFLVTFIKTKAKNRNPLTALLFKQLQAQAELIEYYLRPRN